MIIITHLALSLWRRMRTKQQPQYYETQFMKTHYFLVFPVIILYLVAIYCNTNNNNNNTFILFLRQILNMFSYTQKNPALYPRRKKFYYTKKCIP